MRVTEILNKKKWRHQLQNRLKNFSLFNIPTAIVNSCKVESNIKRQIRMELSNGKKLSGFLNITSGTELYIPVEIQKHLKSVDWFTCEIVGNKTSNEVNWDWK